MSRHATFRLFAPLLVLALGGCSLLGGGRNKDPITIYAPDARISADPSWPTVQWQLAIAKPSASRLLDSPRIAVRPTPGELEVYRGATWSQPAPDLLEGALLRGFEDSGRIAAVARTATGIRPDYKLALDLRRFEADYQGGSTPVATIELNAKLIHSTDQRVVASQSFTQVQPARSTAVADVANAFEQVMQAMGSELIGWTLAHGERDRHRGPDAVDPVTR